jgi:competence protein ComEC
VGNSQTFFLEGIKIKTYRYPEYQWGDRLVVTGRVKINNESRFYREYLLEGPEIERKDIGILRYEDIKSRLLRPIFSFKDRMVGIYRRSLPEPAASLLAGIVLGEKSALPSAFWQALRKTGTLHIVVASGANINFFAGFLMAILPFLFSRKLAYLITVVLIWFYVVLAGGEAPIFRAGVMGTIAYFGLTLGRTSEGIRTLLLAALILLLLRPLSLFDLGFQLSFAATLGIILFSNQNWGVIEKLGKRLGRVLKTTLSAQVFTLPIIFLNFGTFPWLSPLVNLLVYWTIPVLMSLGAAAGILGLVWEPLGNFFCFLSYPLLEYFVKIVEIF